MVSISDSLEFFVEIVPDVVPQRLAILHKGLYDSELLIKQNCFARFQELTTRRPNQLHCLINNICDKLLLEISTKRCTSVPVYWYTTIRI